MGSTGNFIYVIIVVVAVIIVAAVIVIMLRAMPGRISGQGQAAEPEREQDTKTRAQLLRQMELKSDSEPDAEP
jgi:flagellar basal body-associated protein FliL